MGARIAAAALAALMAVALLPEALSAPPALQLLGVTWRKSTLRVFLSGGTVEQKTAVAKAFRLWKAALNRFAERYGSGYVGRIGFELYIEGFNGSVAGYDVYLSIVDDTPQGEEIGLTKLLTVGGEYVERAEVYIYTRDFEGKPLGPSDLTNTAMHEVGHVLCIGHASLPSTLNGPEVMYREYRPVGMTLTPSTLDVQGVAAAFSWLATGRPSPPDLRIVELPPSIPYRLMLYHYVDVKSAVGDAKGGGWYLENATCTVQVEDVVEAGDVKYVFRGWVGTYNASRSEISFEVASNVTLEAVWETWYRVVVTDRSGAGEVEERWLARGSELEVEAPGEVVYAGGRARRVFMGWSGSINSSSRGVRVTVDGPLRLNARWETQYLVDVVFVTGDGEPLQPQPTLFSLDGARHNGTRVWVSKRSHVVDWAVWGDAVLKGVGEPVLDEERLTLSARLDVWRVNLTVTDLLYIPVPGARIVLEGPVKREVYSGVDGRAPAMLLPGGVYSFSLYMGPVRLASGEVSVPSPAGITILVEPSPYLLLLLAGLIAAIMARVKARR